MDFNEFSEHQRLHQAWNAVKIVRDVGYSLFTFGDSDLPYYLISEPSRNKNLVTIQQGKVVVSKPLIYLPDNAPPEFCNFFGQDTNEDLVRFLLARTAKFQNMKFDNTISSEQFVSDSLEESVAKLNQRLDDDEEDRIAILTAPAGLGGVAVLRHCLERVAASGPGNVTELREHGFLA